MLRDTDPLTRNLWLTALGCAIIGVLSLLMGLVDGAVFFSSIGAVLAGGLIVSERSARKSRKDTEHHGS